MLKNVRTPMLILVSGLAGTGKSTLSKRLCREFRLPFIDYDSVCEPFLEILQKKDGVQIRNYTFTRRYREICYSAFLKLVSENLSLGLDLIATAPFTSEMKNPDFFKLVKDRYNVEFHSLDVYIEIDEMDLLKNIKKRGSERDQEKLMDWNSFHQQAGNNIRLWNADWDFCVRAKNGDFISEDFFCLKKKVKEYLNARRKSTEN